MSCLNAEAVCARVLTRACGHEGRKVRIWKEILMCRRPFVWSDGGRARGTYDDSHTNPGKIQRLEMDASLVSVTVYCTVANTKEHLSFSLNLITKIS